MCAEVCTNEINQPWNRYKAPIMNAVSTDCKKRINPFVQRGGYQNDIAALESNSPATDPGYNQGNNSRLLKKQVVNIQRQDQ